MGVARAFRLVWCRSAASDASAWRTVVGLEAHCAVASATKLLSGAPSASAASEPNALVAPFDAALPGTLPALNRACVVAAARLGVALGGCVARHSAWERKHYRYADLPHGFQVTQERFPIVTGGALRGVPVARVQLETDTGKALHGALPGRSALDLNRAGVALLEVVTEPGITGGRHAVEVVLELQRLLRRLGVSDASLEDGSLRVDVNVSVRAPDGRASTRCELKNINSTRLIARAVDAEARRHAAALEAGGDVPFETRTVVDEKGTTAPLRGKDAALDYRFMPEPDIPPVALTDAELAQIAASVPPPEELVAQRLVDELGLSAQQAEALLAARGGLQYFEAALAAGGASRPSAATVAKWVLGESLAAARGAKRTLDKPPGEAAPERLAELLGRVASGELSERMAKPVLAALWEGDGRPLDAVVAEHCGGAPQLRDASELRTLCEQVLAEHPKQADAYRAGKTRLMGLFVGQVMKRTGGRADPPAVTALFEELLSSGSS